MDRCTVHKYNHGTRTGPARDPLPSAVPPFSGESEAEKKHGADADARILQWSLVLLGWRSARPLLSVEDSVCRRMYYNVCTCGCASAGVWSWCHHLLGYYIPLLYTVVMTMIILALSPYLLLSVLIVLGKYCSPRLFRLRRSKQPTSPLRPAIPTPTPTPIPYRLCYLLTWRARSRWVSVPGLCFDLLRSTCLYLGWIGNDDRFRVTRRFHEISCDLAVKSRWASNWDPAGIGLDSVVSAFIFP